jgi:hypothetical protein
MTLPTKLFHYSPHEIVELHSDFHDKHKELYCLFHKPHGLWLSIEDYEDDQNWKTWCEGEEFRLDTLKYRYSVRIKDNSDILMLGTTQEIVDFGRKYALGDRKDYIPEIRWDVIMEKYDGIIIAPYNWECRMPSETMWYYGWDCASGCVWNMDCVELTLDSIQEETQESQEEESGKGSHTESAVR